MSPAIAATLSDAELEAFVSQNYREPAAADQRLSTADRRRLDLWFPKNRRGLHERRS